jgi:hypothetical protein
MTMDECSVAADATKQQTRLVRGMALIGRFLNLHATHVPRNVYQVRRF